MCIMQILEGLVIGLLGDDSAGRVPVARTLGYNLTVEQNSQGVHMSPVASAVESDVKRRLKLNGQPCKTWMLGPPG